MNFIAVYIGHRCTLWFCTFALNTYFSSRKSVSPKEFCREVVYSLCLCYLSFPLWLPVSEQHLFPRSWPSSMVHCLLLDARLWLAVGNSWSSRPSFSKPMHLRLRAGPFLAFLLCSPRQPKSACTCAKSGQETAFCLLKAELCFYWCRLRSLRGSSTPWVSGSLADCGGRWSLLLPFLQEP